MKRLILLLFAATVFAGQQVHHGREGQHRVPRSAEQWIKILEDPERDDWQKPDEVVAALELQPGQDIADIGAGSGYFSVRFAEKVGPDGKVFAVDIEEGLISHMEQRAAERGLSNLVPVLAAPDDPRLAPKSVDWIFICDVIHHLKDRSHYYALLARALKPGGKLVVVDFYKRKLPVGPPPAMKIGKSEMVDELAESGFSLSKEFEFLPYQYFLVFSR